MSSTFVIQRSSFCKCIALRFQTLGLNNPKFTITNRHSNLKLLHLSTQVVSKGKKKKEKEMASSVLSSAAATTITPAQTNKVAAFTGLKSGALPVSKKTNTDITSLASNGGRVSCMLVWPPLGKKKFETLSYLPPLSPESLFKEVEYLLRKGWVPCLEFQIEHPFVYRENHRSPGYYDGRYWTMWKLPMFGCTDAGQVLKELEEAKKAYPNAHVRIIGFDNVRQVQCISFIAYRPPGSESA